MTDFKQTITSKAAELGAISLARHKALQRLDREDLCMGVWIVAVCVAYPIVPIYLWLIIAIKVLLDLYTYLRSIVHFLSLVRAGNRRAKELDQLATEHGEAVAEAQANPPQADPASFLDRYGPETED